MARLQHCTNQGCATRGLQVVCGPQGVNIQTNPPPCLPPGLLSAAIATLAPAVVVAVARVSKTRPHGRRPAGLTAHVAAVAGKGWVGNGSGSGGNRRAHTAAAAGREEIMLFAWQGSWGAPAAPMACSLCSMWPRVHGLCGVWPPVALKLDSYGINVFCSYGLRNCDYWTGAKELKHSHDNSLVHKTAVKILKNPLSAQIESEKTPMWNFSQLL